MAYISNVVITDGSKITYDKSVRRCNDLQQADRNLPTLIVGYDNAKKWIDNYSVMRKWYPEQNLYWTFGKKERKFEYDDDIEDFYRISIERLYKDVKYYYVNIVKLRIYKIKALIEYMNNNDEKVIYNDRNRFLYIYSKEQQKVIGLSLDICEYIGISKEKILRKIKSNNRNIVFTGISFLNRKLRELCFVNKHYIPIFYRFFNS